MHHDLSTGAAGSAPSPLRSTPSRRAGSRLAVALSALVCLALAPAALAGIHYKAVTTTQGEGADQRTAVEGWVDGASAKILFTDSDTPAMQEGQYVITTDGGKTLFLVDPEEKTYAEWDLEAMMAMVGQMMESLGPMLNIDISNVEMEERGSQPGPAMHGLATTHSSYSTSYDMKIKVMGMGRTNHVESEQEIWTTTEVPDEAMTVWLRNAPVSGFGELDELMQAEMNKVKGFPLKSVVKSTTTGQKGKRSTTTTMTTEVTELDRSASVPASAFQVPEGYTRSEAMVPEEGEEEEGNPFSKIFGRN